MLDLEEFGFIEKIYIFLGCVLFEKGYCYYVDYLVFL